MNIASYINDLLYRYDCVIVPNFGGFVTNRIGAKLDENTHVFYPPTKQISFNSHLQHNDGLLVNYIASAENISFENASTAISILVTEWLNDLQSKSVYLQNLGVLSLNEADQIIFEPNTEVNYLTESFGFSGVESSAIKRYKEQVIPLVSAVKKDKNKGVPLFIKYAATAAILLTLGFVVYKNHEENKQQNIFAEQQNSLQKKIQSATFVISNPLPTIALNVSKEIPKPFHVIVGAFQFPENAQKKVNQLIRQGHDAKIIGVNKWGLTEVSYHSYTTRREAINNLHKVQRTVSSDAWLLIKK